MRKSLASLFLVAACWAALSCSPAFAAPTTTAAATFSTGVLLTCSPVPCFSPWTTVLTTDIKNPTADDDLFIDVSQVDTLTTDNGTSSSAPSGFISFGEARLEMQVLVDGIPATPGPITFDDQLTLLTAKLQAFQKLNCTQTTQQNVIVVTTCTCNTLGVVASCAPPPAPPPPLSVRTCTTATFPDPDIVTTCNLVNGGPETLATLLAETIGHSYDFFAKGVPGIGDTHIVQVQERLGLAHSVPGSASATIGKSTLKIMAVNLKN